MAELDRQNRPAHVVIDTAAYRHNLDLVRSWVPGAKIMAIIKADGYGHGMEVAAQSLATAEQFGVNSLDDVARLRASGITQPLNLLSASLTLAELNGLRDSNVRPMCYDTAQLEIFEKIDAQANLSVWIKVDTGMGRLGFAPQDLSEVVARLSKVEGIANLSLMTHLANADDPQHESNSQQFDAFKPLIDTYSFTDISVLNSAGVVSFASSAQTQVRPGLVLYGVSPTIGRSSASLGLRPVMNFNSELISVKHLPRGHSVGYGSTVSLDNDATIGVVAVGYGDGYPRHAPSGTPLLVNGQRAFLLGRVSMDMIAVDLSNVQAQVGDAVELWGENIPVEEVAAAAGTIAYELTCGVLPRVQRIVI